MSQTPAPPFAGKTVLVTGASSGIGRAAAVLLGRQGAEVIVSARREDRARQTVHTIREAGGAAEFIAVDIAREASIDALFAAIERHGPLHGAINNAGTEGEHSLLPDMPVEEFDRVINTNVRGTWLCLRHETRLMRSQGHGSIVNISSIAGVVGFAQSSRLYDQQACRRRHDAIGGPRLRRQRHPRELSVSGRHAHGDVRALGQPRPGW